MSIEMWPDPNNPGKEYPIGTIGFEHRNVISQGIDILGNYIIKDFTKSALLMGAVSSLLDRDGSSVMPTYGDWAGPGWGGGTRSPEGGNVEWETLPCYNSSIKNIENNPELNPDDCISLVDAITKTHDWRYVRPLKSIHMLRCLQSSALRRTRKVRLTSRALRALPLNGFERSGWIIFEERYF